VVETAMYAAAANIRHANALKRVTHLYNRRCLFGDVAMILFLLAQASDGVLTYVGVSVYGLHMEGNPLMGWLMAAFGQGPALAGAKLTAGFFGIALHMSAVHKAVACLAAFYIVVAIGPWVAILFW
jgi:uncharacterized membrane protein